MNKSNKQDTHKKNLKNRKSILSGKIIRRAFILLTVVFLLFSGLLAHYAVSPVDKKRGETIIVDIPTGFSFSHIMRILDEGGLIKNKMFFYCLAVAKQARFAIRAGEYEFSTAQTPWKIIDKLAHGEVKVYRIVIPEDLSIREVAKRLDEYKLINKEIFFDLAGDEEFLKTLNVPADSIEGYLFPDTYYFERWMNTRRIMKKMVDTFWEKVTPEIIEKANESGLDVHQLITLASIIGKEAASHDEKPLVSAVFRNRLKKKMPLQSDPTAIYDLDGFEGKIVRSHLRRKSPYNTYVIRGLPPGPIANPGLTSIKATLQPAPVDYLYFVSKRDGTHHFSSSLAEHNMAVNKYVHHRDEQIQSLKEAETEEQE